MKTPMDLSSFKLHLATLIDICMIDSENLEFSQRNLTLAAMQLAVESNMPWASAEFAIFRAKLPGTAFCSFEPELTFLKFYDEWLSTSNLISDSDDGRVFTNTPF